MNSTLNTGQSSEAKLRQYEEAEELGRFHLAKFDDLDFNVFSNQQWVRLHETHAEDILVHWPDGRQVRGIKQHIEDLSAMFVYAPDTRIKVVHEADRYRKIDQSVHMGTVVRLSAEFLLRVCDESSSRPFAATADVR